MSFSLYDALLFKCDKINSTNELLIFITSKECEYLFNLVCQMKYAL